MPREVAGVRLEVTLGHTYVTRIKEGVGMYNLSKSHMTQERGEHGISSNKQWTISYDTQVNAERAKDSMHESGHGCEYGIT